MKVSELDEIIAAELVQLVDQTALQSGNCAQSSFAVLDEFFGLDGAAVLRALTPMPGVGLRGETCGVVTGCLMALGLVYGRDDLSDQEAMRRAMPPAREFCRRFEARFGSTACNDILELRLGRQFDLAKMDDYADYCRCEGEESCVEVIKDGVINAAAILVSQGGEERNSGVMLTV
jgi:C_GCAxxG_C_C family probable redox protein